MKKLVFYVWMMIGVVVLHAHGDLHQFSCPNPEGKVTATMIEKALEANGFVIAGNSEMTHTLTKTSLPVEGKLLTRFVHSTQDQESGFTLSNFTDYQFVPTDKGGTSPFDFYDTYSICKLKVIYTVAKTHPEAAAFAPCTLMVYKKKSSNEIVMGFPSVYSWLSTAQVNDAEGKAVLLQAQKDFEAVLQGASE